MIIIIIYSLAAWHNSSSVDPIPTILKPDLSKGVIKVSFANLAIAHGPRPKNYKLGPRPTNFGFKRII